MKAGDFVRLREDLGGAFGMVAMSSAVGIVESTDKRGEIAQVRFRGLGNREGTWDDGIDGIWSAMASKLQPLKFRDKLSDWFPPEVKPARPGWYPASACRRPGVRRYWDGTQWSIGVREGVATDEGCAAAKLVPSLSQHDIEWRGRIEVAP